MEQNYWKKCSFCKKEIPYSTQYYLCSVSTCRHKRKGFQFCSVPCWDGHLGYANHRDAWAEEAMSPPAGIGDSPAAAPTRKPVRKIVGSPSGATTPKTSSGASSAASIQTDTLVVVSKVKKLISEQSGFNTSKCCVDALTKKVIEECLKGIENAKKAERKTVMGRDI